MEIQDKRAARIAVRGLLLSSSLVFPALASAQTAPTAETGLGEIIIPATKTT